MEISNFSQKPQKINLYDVVPVSRDEKIRVKLLEVLPQPTESQTNGILRWELKLAPWEKKTVTVAIQVDAPVGMPLPL